jgi:serine phosphatase RsbU (regulator of sigma subunit)
MCPKCSGRVSSSPATSTIGFTFVNYSGSMDTVPRTAALRWFAGAYLLLLGMSFLVLPRGPINPLYGLIWLRGPLFVLSGLVILWLSTLRLSRRAAMITHTAAAIPPAAVAAQYISLGQYAPAAMLFVLALAVALSPLAPARPPACAWRPDAAGFVLGLGIGAQGVDLLVRSRPEVIPYGLQREIALLFLVFGLAVAGSQLVPRMPTVVRAAVHVLAGASVLALWVVLALGVAPILWLLNATAVLVGVAVAALPWLSARLALVATDTVRVRLALGLFTGSLVPLLVAVPIVLALEPATIATAEAAFGVTLVLSLGCAVAGWVLARQLTVPLSRLVEGVRSVSAGVRPVRLTSRAPKEIEELALAVETMASELDDQIQEVREARDQHKTIAEKLQKALQVTTDVFPGVELAHVYQSASELAEVGGDFYDVFYVPDGRIGILIGDVAGKGVDAAAQAVLIRTSVRAFTYYTQSPAEALARANQLLIDTKAAGFVTAFLGILDPASGALLCSTAGHPPAVLIARSQPSFIDEGGYLLGGFASATFEETLHHLGPGDTLLLYTDGLIEAKNGSGFFEPRLMTELKSLAALPPAQLTQDLYARVIEFAGGVARDDIALLAVRLLPALERTPSARVS